MSHNPAHCNWSRPRRAQGLESGITTDGPVGPLPTTRGRRKCGGAQGPPSTQLCSNSNTWIKSRSGSHTLFVLLELGLSSVLAFLGQARLYLHHDALLVPPVTFHPRLIPPWTMAYALLTLPPRWGADPVCTPFHIRAERAQQDPPGLFCGVPHTEHDIVPLRHGARGGHVSPLLPTVGISPPPNHAGRSDCTQPTCAPLSQGAETTVQPAC